MSENMVIRSMVPPPSIHNIFIPEPFDFSCIPIKLREHLTASWYLCFENLSLYAVKLCTKATYAHHWGKNCPWRRPHSEYWAVLFWYHCWCLRKLCRNRLRYYFVVIAFDSRASLWWYFRLALLYHSKCWPLIRLI